MADQTDEFGRGGLCQLLNGLGFEGFVLGIDKFGFNQFVGDQGLVHSVHKRGSQTFLANHYNRFETMGQAPQIFTLVTRKMGHEILPPSQSVDNKAQVGVDTVDLLAHIMNNAVGAYGNALNGVHGRDQFGILVFQDIELAVDMRQINNDSQQADSQNNGLPLLFHKIHNATPKYG
jgi:hypothetical protein